MKIWNQWSVGLVIGCLFLPDGNPSPGPKFDYKLERFERLRKHAKALLAQDVPVVLAGDFNFIPTELDAKKRKTGFTMRCSSLNRVNPSCTYRPQLGTDAAMCHQPCLDPQP